MTVFVRGCDCDCEGVEETGVESVRVGRDGPAPFPFRRDGPGVALFEMRPEPLAPAMVGKEPFRPYRGSDLLGRPLLRAGVLLPSSSGAGVGVGRAK